VRAQVARVNKSTRRKPRNCWGLSLAADAGKAAFSAPFPHPLARRCGWPNPALSLPAMASGDPEKSGIYRVIRLVAIIDFLAGLGFLFLGPLLLGTNDFFYLGLGLALAGAFVFIFFTILAARAAGR